MIDITMVGPMSFAKAGVSTVCLTLYIKYNTSQFAQLKNHFMFHYVY